MEQIKQNIPGNKTETIQNIKPWNLNIYALSSASSNISRIPRTTFLIGINLFYRLNFLRTHNLWRMHDYITQWPPPKIEADFLESSLSLLQLQFLKKFLCLGKIFFLDYSVFILLPYFYFLLQFIFHNQLVS